MPFGWVVPYSWGEGRFGKIQKFLSEEKWEEVRREAHCTGKMRQRVWLAQWGEGRKELAHHQPTARMGKKRKLTAGLGEWLQYGHIYAL